MKEIQNLVNKLINLEDKIEEKLIEAQRQTAIDVALDTRKLAPKNTGRYADSIKVSPTIKDGSIIETYIYSDMKVISTQGKQWYLGQLLETGTSPHLIYPVNAKYLHFLIDGKDVYTKLVHHPGTIAQPHYLPAINSNKQRYINNIKKAFKEAIK